MGTLSENFRYAFVWSFTLVLGAQFGTVISMPLSGLLSVSEWGWPSVFYVFGALGTIWCIFFLIFVYEDPFSSPRINDDERKYIQKTLGVIDGAAVRIIYCIAGIIFNSCSTNTFYMIFASIVDSIE